MKGGMKEKWPYIVAAAVVVLVIGYVVKTANITPVSVGMVAPDFTLSTVDGKTVHLSDLRGKVVMLNFWATWCKPCRQEMPSMEEMYHGFKNLAGERFELIAVNENNVFYQGKIRPFLTKYGIDFPVPVDPLGKLDHLYKITGVPETFIIDQKGVVAEHVIGPRDWRMKDSLVTVHSLLDHGPSTPAAYLAAKKDAASGY
ncbi:MAG: TlpA family protein disulfide reductase [Nitrospirae bacterium]|jgi:peroxiredoxin|nr:TlpA family protein disulfide reductase [Nitrospirota bacterium]